jgi:hypothetical protein
MALSADIFRRRPKAWPETRRPPKKRLARPMHRPMSLPAEPRMRQFRPLSMLRPVRVRLSLAFVTFLLLVVGVGAFGIDQLASFHSVSSQISGRWLQSSRILGDLNNSISDYRYGEAEYARSIGSSSLNGIRTAI